MNNPAVLFYTSDFITGTLFMSNEEVGAYIRVLCMQHQKGHLSKEDMQKICKNETIFLQILPHFKKDRKGLYYNERMEIESEKRSKFVESRAKNRKKKKKTSEEDMNNISKTYEEHMENGNENENINEFNNIDLKHKVVLDLLQESGYIYFNTPDEFNVVNYLSKVDEELLKECIEIAKIKNKMDLNYILGIVLNKLKQEKNKKKDMGLPEWFDKEYQREELLNDEERRILEEIENSTNKS